MESLTWFHLHLELQRAELTEAACRMAVARTEGWQGGAGKAEVSVKGCEVNNNDTCVVELFLPEWNIPPGVRREVREALETKLPRPNLEVT